MKLKQYLFNARLFYKNGGAGEGGCPPLLCFPTFFALSVVSLVNNSHTVQSPRQRKAMALSADAFVYILPILLRRLVAEQKPFGLLSPTEIRRRMFVEGQEEEKEDEGEGGGSDGPRRRSLARLRLEHYLATETEGQRYLALLEETNLKWNRVPSRHDLVQHLLEQGVCRDEKEQEEEEQDEEEEEGEEDDSLQYTTIGTTAATTRWQGRIGPSLWGPYYWRIFHAIPQDGEDEDIRYLVDAMPSLLPFLLPCRLCTDNYHRHIKPSTLPTALDQPVKLYEDIHRLVTAHTR